VADEDGFITLVGRPVLEHILEMRRGLDTIITLKDGKVGAHRMVLTAASPFLGEMLLDQVCRIYNLSQYLAIVGS